MCVWCGNCNSLVLSCEIADKELEELKESQGGVLVGGQELDCLCHPDSETAILCVHCDNCHEELGDPTVYPEEMEDYED